MEMIYGRLGISDLYGHWFYLAHPILHSVAFSNCAPQSDNLFIMTKLIFSMTCFCSLTIWPMLVLLAKTDLIVD
jgi:hypothetical protein